MVTDGNYIYHDKHFVMYINVDSLSCTCETIILCQLYISEKKTKYIISYHSNSV